MLHKDKDQSETSHNSPTNQPLPVISLSTYNDDRSEVWGYVHLLQTLPHNVCRQWHGSWWRHIRGWRDAGFSKAESDEWRRVLQEVPDGHSKDYRNKQLPNLLRDDPKGHQRGLALIIQTCKLYYKLLYFKCIFIYFVENRFF